MGIILSQTITQCTQIICYPYPHKKLERFLRKKTYLRFTWLYILIIIINTKLTSYTSH